MSFGKLIAGVGLPGCGKSRLFEALEKLSGAQCFLEPEEGDWDRAVTGRDRYGHIGGLHWFRSQRVPHLVDARHAADNGATVLVDTFYDKVCSFYLGKPGMEWLLAPEDPYFANFLETARIDLERLPDADCLVSISVTEEDWKMMLGSRGRRLDQMVKLSETFATQSLFHDAARQYCSARGVRLIEFANVFSTVDESANRLHSLLVQEGVL